MHLHAKYLLFLSRIKLVFAQQIFKKHQNVKFHENMSSESWIIPCRWI